MDYLEIANSIPLWIACGVCVALVFFQSVLFTKKALAVAKRMDITDEQIKMAFTTSISSSIGPSIVIVIGLVSLMVSMGSPVAWFRLAFIGSVTYELMAAAFGAQAVGATLGSADMTANAFASGVWTMVLCSVPWILVTAIFTPKLDQLRMAMAGGNKAVVPIVSAGAMCGAFSYLCMQRVLRFDSQTAAVLGGFALMLSFTLFNKKRKIKWLKEWAFTISMFGGMLVSTLF